MGETEAGGGRWREAWSSMPPTVWVLSAIAFFVAVGYGVIVPVLPLVATSFGVGLAEVGVVIGVFALSRVLMSPFVPRLINKFGDRVVLSAGQYMTAVSYALMGFSQSYEQLVLFRFLAGIGSVLFTISAMNLLVTVAPPNRRARAVGVWQGGFLLGTMLGPALGGALALISLTAPFFFYAVSVAAAGTVGLFFLRKRPTKKRNVEIKTGIVPAPSFGTVARDRGFQAALVTNLGQGWAVIGVRTSLVPVIITSVFHHDPVWSGVAFAAGAVAQTVALFPVTRFVDTAGRRLGIIIGTVVCALATIGLALAPNLWTLIIALVVMGFGTAFTGTAPAAAVADAAGSKASRPLAAFSMMQDFGQIIGPVVAGLLWDHTSPILAFGVGAGILLLGMVAGLRMPRR